MYYNISMIACMNPNYVIGRNGDLAWSCKSDMKHFIEFTRGKTVVMGRKTWDSLPRKPLPGRRNIVLSRDTSSEIEGADTLTVDQVLLLSDSEEVVVIGGEEIYKEFLPYAKNVLLNVVEAVVKSGDTHFPYEEMLKTHRMLSCVEDTTVIEIPSDGISQTVKISYQHYVPKN